MARFRRGELVRRLTGALAAESARVLDATGTSAVDKQRFLTKLKAEQRQTFATSTFDVMIGIQRVLEGTDWPLCSAVYSVGMPGSLNTVVQFLGRAMRLKRPDYPTEHRDRANLVFFVPCGGGEALADLSIDHSRHALLTCCFLADHEVGQEWIVTQEVRRGIEAALGCPADNPAAADAENEADEPIDPAIRAEVELAIASAREQIVSNGGNATLGEVMELTAKTRPNLPEAAVKRVAAEILAAQTTITGSAARKAIQEEIGKRLRIDPRVKQAMTEAFAVVLEEFRDATLRDSTVLESVGRQVHGVTGGQMQQFAQRLHDAAPRPLTVEKILAWADAYHARTPNEWPVEDSGQVLDAPGETWANISNALRGGFRGLPGNSSLARLLTEHRGVPNTKDQLPLTVEQILAWADAHYHRTGDWPRQSSRDVVGSPDEDWRNVDVSLRRGNRGLSGGCSLATLLSDQRRVRIVNDPPQIKEEQILIWADAHQKRTGVWPGQNTGSVQESPDDTWAAINQSLRLGLRGLPGNSSLTQLLEKQRGVPNRGKPLSEEQILAWADAHNRRTGQWPKKNTGGISESPGDTWSKINQALRNGLRGMPEGSSLAKFLARHRGVPIVGKAPSLTVEQILVWADAHFVRNGVWPGQKSGRILEAPTEKWEGIERALRTGIRGLPGGSSLAQLFAKERGARNPAEPRPLTEERILAWADAHFQEAGDWPKVQSGPLIGVPNETWRNIGTALVTGSRGLPGKSSLAQLLAEKRGVRTHGRFRPLTVEQIFIWADSFHESNNRWPGQDSGAVEGAPDENWRNIDNALRLGLRGLPGNSSLSRLIKENMDPTVRTWKRAEKPYEMGHFHDTDS